MALKKTNEDVALVLKCSYAECYYIATELEAKNILGSSYLAYFTTLAPKKEACIICGKINGLNAIIDRNHSLCVVCLRMYLFKKEGCIKHIDESDMEIWHICPFPGCFKKFNVRMYLKQLSKADIAALKKQLSKSQPYFGELWNKAMIMDTSVACIFCNFNVPVSLQKRILPCKHIFHKDCLVMYIIKSPCTKSLHDILCPICNRPFGKKEVMGLLQADVIAIEKFKKYATNYKIKTEGMICHCCMRRHIDQNDLGRIYKCGSYEICRICLDPKHDPVNCLPRKWIINKFEEEKKRVLPCPSCLYFNILLDKNPKEICVLCNHQLCGYCGASMEKVFAHGSKYHRPSCPESKKMVIEGTGECDICLKRGKVCLPPGDLEFGDIPILEIPSEYLPK